MLKQIKINLKFLILLTTILLFSGCVVDNIESNKEGVDKNTKGYYLVVVNDINDSNNGYMNVISNDDINKENPINLDLTKEKDVNSSTDLPTAYEQSLNVNRNGSVYFYLRGSSSSKSDSLTYEITTEPSHGSVFEWGSSYVYFPEHGYHGDDSFGFIVNDGFGDSEEAYISVKVH